MVKCVGGSLGVLVRLVWKSQGVGVGGFVSEFWTSGTDYLLTLTIIMSRVC